MSQNIQQLTQHLASLLLQKSIRVCTAESCTGGLIAKTFTDLAGSSEWFDRGFVTYSNQSKVDMLGVQSVTLQKYGAVSEEVASEMAVGALQFSQSRLAIAVTGIAGPGGGSETKPVGTVCFGFALKNDADENKVWVKQRWFEGSRSQVREASLLFALRHIQSLLTTSL
ncbi:MAG: CinA family protein [Gammaproteobacteria bacterium]|nr:CinA family protein [Gammaproteobacteria bacterium]